MKDFSIGETLDSSWKKMKERYLTFLAIILFVTFIPGLISLLGPTSNKSVADTPGILPTPIWSVLFIIVFIVSILASFLLIKAALQTSDGNTMGFSKLVANFRGFWSLIWTGILLALIYIAIFAVFAVIATIIAFFKIPLPAFYATLAILGVIAVVLAIIINLTFFFSAYISIDVGRGGVSALKRSAAITKNIKSKLFIFLIVIVVISFIGSFISAIIGGITSAIASAASPVLARLIMLAVQTLVMSFVLPLTVISIVSVYRKLDALTPGIGLEVPPVNTPVVPPASATPAVQK